MNGTQKFWITAEVDEGMDKATRLVAAHEATSKSDILRRALADYIEQRYPEIAKICLGEIELPTPV